MKSLIIIYFHEVVEKGEGFSYQKIEKEKFEEQMKYLNDEGYQSLFFSELEKEWPEKAIIVSFDDGFRSVYENAAPIMEKYNIKGNIYLPTQYIEKDDKFMTWKMVQELDKKKQFEFAAHTHNHVDIRILKKETFYQEVETSNKMIKEKLGYVPEAFCMPYGVYDKKSINILQGFGTYKYILGSFYGEIQQDKLMNQIIPRIGISNDDTISIFKKKLEGKLNLKGYLQKIRLYMQSKLGNRVTEYKY